MEHFGDLEEQVSISIDQNEIPVSDSKDDSFSSSVFEEFGIFKGNGLSRIHEGSKCYQIITGCVAQGMGKDTNVAAVHKIPLSGPNGRLEAFCISLAEMVKKCGGNGNAKHAWYGGSMAEICGIISHGFRRCRQSDHGEDGFGVHLYPLEFVMDGFTRLDYFLSELILCRLLTAIEDDYGLRHLLLCNVILGNMEVVRPGSKQFKPSSDEFYSGVDHLPRPTRIIIWEAYMNSQIFPSYVISFRALNVRGFGRDQTPVYKPTTPSVEFSVLIPELANVLPPSKMALLHKYQSEFRRKKISRTQLIHRMRQLAGDELLNDVIKARDSDGTGAA
ncbi:probable inactive poly [ADP-ribose] polymerase SRO2 [Rhododendron vialii]|uniref:probable inactive poly [ADP-ribose] polymerase SRO2 n=1 Tax=Rhododendron vialii TaxID=182163 RepID=UPI00265EFBAE|nr:probable inactive poly [ADP-ribose] polymerase SRO2 [Rhododendron vialii]